MLIDAEKAFDNISWCFIKKQIKLMGLGERFERGIEAIYTNQKARLIINGITTENIEIRKGTRQGCL